MKIFFTIQVNIERKHVLYDYCDCMTRLTNNLYNAVLFRQRQVLFALRKDKESWSDNEHAVMEEFGMPTYVPNYNAIDKVLKDTKNPDYFAEGLPRQTAQHTIRLCVCNMKSFFSSLCEYRKNPERFTNVPGIPKYRRKKGHTVAILTNQDCTVREVNRRWYAKLPLTKKRLCIGSVRNAKLKQAVIVPENGRYRICFQFETDRELPAVRTSERICSIDFGVRNLMAVTNNCDLPCLLYKGGDIRSANQLYNKVIANIVSKQTVCTGKKFVPTKEYYNVTNRRNNCINDSLHKYAKHLVRWCVGHRIDTIVLGTNRMWKQNVRIGKRNNQNFVCIPYERLRNIISYLASWNGIRTIIQEESYTSKASFLDNDPIPTYKEETKGAYVFSGKRAPTRAFGRYKKGGFRGLYVTKDGTIINADLNGSANIMRKAFPLVQTVDFKRVEIIRYPILRKSNPTGIEAL